MLTIRIAGSTYVNVKTIVEGVTFGTALTVFVIFSFLL